MRNYKDKPIVVFVVPTGIGASVGGFAGDASLYAKSFTDKFNVIVNPNVVNAACFSGINDNMLYTEGYTLNRFFKGEINLVPSENNRIGVIFDKGISQNIINVHINTINAVRTVYGIDFIGYEITEEPCDVSFYNTKEGISSGSVLNEKTLKKAGEKLLNKGAQVIAVVCKFDEPPEDDYQNGTGVDIVGGVEAVISHWLSRELNVPVVHAPAFEDITITSDIVDAKTAAEYITPTFLPCLLLGLKNAPLISSDFEEYYICKDDVKALIMPYNALGASIVSDALKSGIEVFAVKENATVLNITKDAANLNMIREIDTYADCKKTAEDIIYAKK